MNVRIILIPALMCGVLSCSNGPRHEADATLVLDAMADRIGQMHSCSFSVSTTTDQSIDKLGLVQRNQWSDVYMVGPNKMRVNTRGDKRRGGYWYNGSTMTYFSYDKNTYATVKAPDRILLAIEEVHNTYNVDFPAADFFYPTFTEDLLANNPTVALVGQTQINGIECDQILARSKDTTTQIWVMRYGQRLPVRLLITVDGGERYEATISNWVVDPELADNFFEFVPPSGAKEITLNMTEDK